jgi:hypothetical protein
MNRFDDDDDVDRDWSIDDQLDEDTDDADEQQVPTVPCPACGREIYEEADACPYCGEYVAFDAPPAAGKPWWFWLGLALCLAVMLSGALYSLALLLS